MEKNERRRTMVYSNVNKKADRMSASNKNLINIDDEVFIGLANKNSKKNNQEKKNLKKRNKSNNQSNDDVKTLWENEKKEIEKEEKKLEKKNSKKNNLNSEKDVNQKQDDKSEKKINKKNDEENAIEKKQAKAQKAVPIQERIRRQKIRIIKRMAGIVLLLILLIGGFVYFLLSPVFNIKTINVTNNSSLNAQAIINASGIKVDQNLFKFSKRNAEKSIKSNPYIEDVKIKRKPFNTVEIEVKERTATLMLEYGNSYVYINNQGYILEVSTVKLNVPIITGYVTKLEQIKPGNRLSKDDLERLTKVLNIMEVATANGLNELITKIDIENKKNYTVTMESEYKVIYLGECNDLSTQVLYIKEMLEREKGIEGYFYLDMNLNANNPVFREKV